MKFESAWAGLSSKHFPVCLCILIPLLSLLHYISVAAAQVFFCVFSRLRSTGRCDFKREHLNPRPLCFSGHSEMLARLLSSCRQNIPDVFTRSQMDADANAMPTGHMCTAWQQSHSRGHRDALKTKNQLRGRLMAYLSVPPRSCSISRCSNERS